MQREIVGVNYSCWSRLVTYVEENFFINKMWFNLKHFVYFSFQK